MGKKKDPSITFLNKWGYNVVKLPRADIAPLDLVGVDRGTQWLGALASVWTSTRPTPVPAPPRPASNINGQKTDALDISFGLNVLANALAAFGVDAPSLETSYHSASKVQFSYTNVTSSIVSPLDAGSYLAAGSLQTDNPTVQNYFQNPDCSAYLITSVIKSDSITVSATDDHGASVGVDVPALSQMIGAKVKVSPSSSANSSVTFTGPQPLTFGFIVQQISYADGKWSLRDAPASGATAFGASAGGPGTGPAHTPGAAARGIILGDPDDCRIDLS